MGFRFGFERDKVLSALNDASSKLIAEQRAVLNVIGVRILSFSQQAYRVKSRGGTGDDGIKWKPLAESTIKAKNRRGKKNAKRKTTKNGKARPAGGQVAIGINTGLQLASASPGFSAPDSKGGNLFVLTDRSVTVGYKREYSGYFDEVRPLLPDALPDKWQKACDKIVSDWANKIVRDGLKGLS